MSALLALSAALSIHITVFYGALKFSHTHLPLTTKPWPQWTFIAASTADVSLLLMIVSQNLPFRGSGRAIMLKGLQLDLATMLIAAWLVVPLSIWRVTRLGIRCKSPESRLIGGTIIILLYTVLLAHVGALIGIPKWSIRPAHMVARISTLGVCIGSALAGYGSIQFPLANLKSLFGHVSQARMNELQTQVTAVLRQRAQLCADIETLRSQNGLDNPWTPEGDKFICRGFSVPEGLMLNTSISDPEAPPDDDMYAVAGGGHRHVSAHTPSIAARRRMTRNEAIREISSMAAEVASLEMVANDLVKALDEMRTTHSRYLRAQTAEGRALNLLAWVMVGACLYRVTTALGNVVFGRVSEGDLATKVVEIALQYLKIDIDVEAWASYLTLLYVGFLVYSTVQSFSARILSFVRSAADRLGPDLLVLAVTEIATLYFCSCALLLRTNLPRHRRIQLEKVYGSELNFKSFHLQFDLIFAVSCMVSVAVAIVQQRQRSWQLLQEAAV